MDRPCNCPEGSPAKFLISFCVYLLQKIGMTFSATIWMKLSIGQRIERKKSSTGLFGISKHNVELPNTALLQ